MSMTLIKNLQNLLMAMIPAEFLNLCIFHWIPLEPELKQYHFIMYKALTVCQESKGQLKVFQEPRSTLRGFSGRSENIRSSFSMEKISNELNHKWPLSLLHKYEACLKFAVGDLGNPMKCWENIVWSNEVKADLFLCGYTQRLWLEEEWIKTEHC